MKLELGMYCYDKTNRKYGIGKIAGIEEHQNYIIRYKNHMNLVSIGNIIASFNPIDLIKVEDVVYLEEYNDYACEIFRYIHMIENEDNLLHIIDDIKKEKIKLLSIMTKEFFENNCFKIGDE